MPRHPKIHQLLENAGRGVAAGALLLATVSADLPAHANPFNSGKQGQPVINGVASGQGDLYTLLNINQDQFIQTNEGTAIVWSASDDHILRKYDLLGSAGQIGNVDAYHHPNFGYDDATMNSSALMGYQGIYNDGSTPLWSIQFQLALGGYGVDSYLHKVSEPYVQFVPDNATLVYGTEAAPGDVISADGIQNPGVSMYNRGIVNTSVAGVPGSFDIDSAWAGATDFSTDVAAIGEKNWTKPPSGRLHAAYSYYDQEFGLSSLPTVSVQWGGSYQSFQTLSTGQCAGMNGHSESHNVDVCNTRATSTTFMMIDGTGSRLCDPVQMNFLPDIAIAVYVANGIYCDKLQVNTYYPSPKNPIGSSGPPLNITTSPATQSGWATGGYLATGQLLNPGAGDPNTGNAIGPCLDVAGNSSC